MTGTGSGRGGPPIGRGMRQPGPGSPRHGVPEPSLAHRERLRRFELVAGHVLPDVTIELAVIGPGASATGVVFVRGSGHIRRAGPRPTLRIESASERPSCPQPASRAGASGGG
jgi:hypothetical protein